MASTLPSVNACCTGCASISIPVTITPTTVTGWYVANTIPDLRVLANASTNQWAEVLGNAAVGDGGGGGYSWQAAALNADDGITWIKPNDTVIGSPGRWYKLS